MLGEPGKRQQQISSHFDRQTSRQLASVDSEAVKSSGTVDDHQPGKQAFELFEIFEQLGGTCLNKAIMARSTPQARTDAARWTSRMGTRPAAR